LRVYVYASLFVTLFVALLFLSHLKFVLRGFLLFRGGKDLQQQQTKGTNISDHADHHQAQRSSSASNKRRPLDAVTGVHCDAWPVPPGDVVPAGHAVQTNVRSSKFCSKLGAHELHENVGVSKYPLLQALQM
jgi:hypothetical protein